MDLHVRIWTRIRVLVLCVDGVEIVVIRRSKALSGLLTTRRMCGSHENNNLFLSCRTERVLGDLSSLWQLC